MASPNSGEGKLNVKRGRKKRSNSSEHTKALIEADISKKEDNREEEIQSNMEVDIPELPRDNEPRAPKDALDALDMMTEKSNVQKPDNTETVTQTLGNAEFPIDVELAADFEDITEKSCNNSMKTDFNTDGLAEKTDATSQSELLTTIVHNEDANVCSGPLEEDLFFGERNSSEQDPGDNEGDAMDAQASDTSHNDQVVDEGKRSTAPKQGQANENGGEVDANNCRDFKVDTGDNEDDVMEMQVGETSHHDQEVDDGNCNTPPKQGQVTNNKGDLATNSSRKSGQEARDNEDDVMEIQDGETSHNANDQGVSGGECNTTAKDEQPEKNEEEETKTKGRERPRRKRAAKMAVTQDCNEDKGKKQRRERPRKERVEENLEQKEFHAALLKLWPPEGEFNFSKEARQKIRLFLKRKRKLRCLKEGCDKSYINTSGFEYHVLRCGGISLNFPCEQCKSVYKSASGLAYHHRAVHNAEVVEDESNIGFNDRGMSKETSDEPEQTESKEKKSKYTFRRRSQPERFISENNEEASESEPEEDDYKPDRNSKPENDCSESSSDESDPSSKSLRSRSWRKYREVVYGSGEEKITTEFTNMSEISKEIKESGVLKCPKRCGRSFKTAAGAYQHIKKCPGKKQKYRCKFCNNVWQSRNGIKWHLVRKHRKKKHDSENDEESEYTESEIDVANQTPAPGRYIKKHHYEKQTKDWYDAFLAKTVLTCWRPSLKHWKKLPVSEAEHYLPVRKISSVFKIESVDKEKWTPEQDKEYQLPLFSSAPINSVGGLRNVIFNVGGSVWAMDWVPIPVNKENCDQYLAIGCHSDPDKNHLISQCYQEKGVLQIWRVPKLHNGKRPPKEPEFCLGIAHDYGPLWDMKWCPSGAWDSSSPQGEELRRLGLLALACADGKIRVLSVPFPSSLEQDDGQADKSPVNLLHVAVPHVVLSPGSLCRKYQGECGAAWVVSWQPIYGHEKVIASYADGTVALWNLKTDSRILKSSSPDGLTELIFPISHFQAHNSVIRGLAWCASEPNYIATGGYDGAVKIWDLRHTSQPVVQYGKVWNYHLTWPLHRGILIFNTDIVSRVKSTRCVDYFSSSRTKQITHVSSCFITHNASGWDHDYSLWTNLVASADAAGVISFSFLTEVVSKRRAKMSQGIFRAVAEPIVRCQGQNQQDVQDESTPNSTKNEFKIVFKDANLLSEKTAEEEAMFNETAHTQPNQPTHTALHKVRWNPNFSSYKWLATAGKAGLVRLCYVNKK